MHGPDRHLVRISVDQRIQFMMGQTCSGCSRYARGTSCGDRTKTPISPGRIPDPAHSLSQLATASVSWLGVANICGPIVVTK